MIELASSSKNDVGATSDQGSSQNNSSQPQKSISSNTGIPPTRYYRDTQKAFAPAQLAYSIEKLLNFNVYNPLEIPNSMFSNSYAYLKTHNEYWGEFEAHKLHSESHLGTLTFVKTNAYPDGVKSTFHIMRHRLSSVESLSFHIYVKSVWKNATDPFPTRLRATCTNATGQYKVEIVDWQNMPDPDYYLTLLDGAAFKKSPVAPPPVAKTENTGLEIAVTPPPYTALAASGGGNSEDIVINIKIPPQCSVSVDGVKKERDVVIRISVPPSV